MAKRNRRSIPPLAPTLLADLPERWKAPLLALLKAREPFLPENLALELLEYFLFPGSYYQQERCSKTRPTSARKNTTAL